MWNEIVNENDLNDFMNIHFCFHDSCLKEFKYTSGAYVNEDLLMHPINNQRNLKIIIQRQYETHSAIEIEFKGLKFLKIFPCDESYTCEILDVTMIMKEDCIYWCDCGGLTEADLDNYKGTIICASKARWRPLENCMGNKELYLSIKTT
ncbi:MAG: hypothetical protein MJ120_07035 [Clostridia bacterium]|nr:hypothetical protein [Clostridia bacterium]